MDNKLSLHLGKTEAMIFCSRVECSDVEINYVKWSNTLDFKLMMTYLDNMQSKNILNKANSRLKF